MINNTKFVFDDAGRTVTFADTVPRVEERLPTDVYALRHDPKVGLYLERVDEFSVPEKLYGDVRKQAERMVQTFDTRKGVTGALLTGEKGSGKSLLGKLVALTLMKERDMPIIIMNIPASGDDLGIFLQKIGRPVTLFFDEFEKVYGRPEAQNALLTILDGVYPLKLMAILTSNDDSKITGPLLNRPGRVFYKINYEGLDYNFIMEYAEANLKNKTHIAELSRLALLTSLNFDQVQALIEEMNRYDESVEEAVQMLNITTERDSFFGLRIVSLAVSGEPVAQEQLASTYYGGELSLTEDEPVEIHYEGVNDSGKTWIDFINDLDRDGDMYTFRDAWKSKFRWPNTMEGRNEVMPSLPMTAQFGADSKLEVRRSGHIVISNDNGDQLVLEKPKKYNRKQF